MNSLKDRVDGDDYDDDEEEDILFVWLGTGRRHQIRLHAIAGFGRPVAGDVMYGAERPPRRNRVKRPKPGASTTAVPCDWHQDEGIEDRP